MNTLEEVLDEVNRCGSVTLHRDGNVYSVALRPTGRPVDIEGERQFIAEKSKGATKEKALAALAKFAAAGDVED